MLKRTFVVLTAVVLIAAHLPAQEAKPVVPEKADPKPAPAHARDEAKRVNVKLDLTITDQSGAGEPGKRTVSMIVADRQHGRIRSGGSVVVANSRIGVTLNVDARPVILEDDRILLELGLEYAPKPETESATTGEGRATLTEQLGLIVVPGKTMVISQASDPTSDRRITVELMTTILK